MRHSPRMRPCLKPQPSPDNVVQGYTGHHALATDLDAGVQTLSRTEAMIFTTSIACRGGRVRSARPQLVFRGQSEVPVGRFSDSVITPFVPQLERKFILLCLCGYQAASWWLARLRCPLAAAAHTHAVNRFSNHRDLALCRCILCSLSY